MKSLCVLGITGSIGQNVVDVVKQNPSDFKIVGAAFHHNVSIFNQLIGSLPDLKYLSVGSEKIKKELEIRYPHLTIFVGEEGCIDVLDAYPYDMMVNALVGFVGLYPTLHALTHGMDCALANKESLVVGGSLIQEALDTYHQHLYPIDSEHVALAKCLKNKKIEDIDSLIITASGGSFRDLSRDQLKNVTVKEALNHPSWKMGAKITIDSATMMNKGFEIIEAYYLFHFSLDKIKVLLHDESMIHSAIIMKDHSWVADLGPADMRVPISYALYEGNYHQVDVNDFDLSKVGSLHFRVLDESRYPALEMAKDALRIGGSMPTVLNGANEAANLAFREGRLPFDQIEIIVKKVMDKHKIVVNPSYEDLKRVHMWSMSIVEELILEGE